MTSAEQLVRLVEQDLEEVEAALRAHPYVAAVVAGDCPLAGLQAFVGTQYHLADSDARSVALMIHRFGDKPFAGFFRDVLSGEFAAQEGIVTLAKKLQMSEADLKAYEPTARGFAYGTYLLWLSSHGTAAQIMCGMLVNFAAWGANCAKMGEGLRAHYGCAREDTGFVDGFAELPSFAPEALPVIEAGLAHGEDPESLRRQARLFQAYEKMFWDDMARAAGIQ
ncbi:MAG: hypothetical protein AAF495_24625 [Pseudomonadota bacterium]